MEFTSHSHMMMKLEILLRLVVSAGLVAGLTGGETTLPLDDTVAPGISLMR